MPVFLEPGEAPEDMLASTSYRPLVRLLQALRSHDDDLVQELAAPQATSRKRKGTDVLELAEQRPAEGEPEARPLLRFSTSRDPNVIADFVRLRVIDPERETWRRGYAAAGRMEIDRIDKLNAIGMVWHTHDVAFEQGLAMARVYHAAHGHLSPQRDDAIDGFPIGQWVSNMRRKGVLDKYPERAEALNDLGMKWTS